MNHPEAHNLLDQRKAGADIPQHVINLALFLTGDMTENDLLRVNTYSIGSEYGHNCSTNQANKPHHVHQTI